MRHKSFLNFQRRDIIPTCLRQLVKLAGTAVLFLPLIIISLILFVMQQCPFSSMTPHRPC
ncbi:hypothetical protein BDV23DRAFT_162142 [Aspergillus alliaceus]|uniref:Uncharacterized protein n=1 Tax=Petromyces alliaceus TaxID=209559 RepID=A0A5N7BYS8_PETAA|nr:hypothetical protein BDV23DRAFT_162142 [Aspergillus alliaceus]